MTLEGEKESIGNLYDTRYSLIGFSRQPASTVAPLSRPLAPPLVEVVYVDPEKFTDVRNGYTQTPFWARDFFLAEIRRHVEASSRAKPDGRG